MLFDTLNFRNGPNLRAPFKPYARPLTIPINEDHAARFEGTAYFRNRGSPQFRCSSFKLADS